MTNVAIDLGNTADDTLVSLLESAHKRLSRLASKPSLTFEQSLEHANLVRVIARVTREQESRSLASKRNNSCLPVTEFANPVDLDTLPKHLLIGMRNDLRGQYALACQGTSTIPGFSANQIITLFDRIDIACVRNGFVSALD